MKASPKFILLHLGCTLRRPQNWRFHAAGILREVNRLQPTLRPLVSSLMALL